MRISPRQIEAFLALMECGTVTAAAERLYVSQPAVSRMLSRFQYEAGFKAFKRRGNKLEPTAAAQVFYFEVKRVYKGLDHLNIIAKELQENRRGYLNICVMPALSNSWITSQIKDFLTGRDNVFVSITPKPSHDIIDSVSKQILDLGITGLRSDTQGIDFHPLPPLVAVCILPAHHPLCEKNLITAQDLSGQDFVSLSNIDNSRTRIDQIFENQGIQRKIKLETAQASTICHMVASGIGVSIVTQYAAEEASYLGFQIRPLEPSISFPIYLVQSTRRKYSSLVDEFVEQILRKI
ncbi:MAG: LysR family transcriptional regulator [Gammaproteobacteria bacterium]|nr:LysR family transcriptional regulator [Gammaproteobacteria bacterium]